MFNHRIEILGTVLDWTKDGLRKAQERNGELAPLSKWKETMPDGPEKKDVLMFGMAMRSYVQQWDDLYLSGSVLYRTWRSKDGLHQYEQLVTPCGYQNVLMRLVHEQGHFGVDKTCEQLRQRAYWYGWKTTVKIELGCCTNCAQYFRGKPPRQAGLQPMVYEVPWGRVAINITGKHPRSRNGYEYILTVMDYCTKWAEAYPIRDHKSTTVTRVLLENCFTRLGIPEEIIGDQGREFEGELFIDLCRSFNINKLRTSPYRPWTNGMVERYHWTLNQMMGKVVSDTPRDWDLHMPAAAAAYRASKHVVTGFAPNFMMLGREALSASGHRPWGAGKRSRALGKCPRVCC